MDLFEGSNHQGRQFYIFNIIQRKGTDQTMAANTNDFLYLVAGAAGFLGGTVCCQLAERGNKARAFILPNDLAPKYIMEGCS